MGGVILGGRNIGDRGERERIIEEQLFCVSSAHWERIRPLESLVCLFLVISIFSH